MKKILITALLAIASQAMLAQHDLHCATDKIMNAYYQQHPEAKLKKQQEDLARLNHPKDNSHTTAASFTIPIVFHILHVGGPENISDAQVRDGLRILNRDYAKQNPDTVQIIPSMKPLADSMRIQFALATIDPNGNCTNGIIHHYDTNTDWYDTSATLYSHTWDPTKYLNVYIVRTIILSGGFGAAGYTYFPGTFAPGDQADAIVVLNNYFGSIGTGSAFTSRVLTHEVGHWLSLYHVFGGTNGAGVDCNTDDYISDTPQTAGFLSCPDVNDPASYQLCTPGVDENFQNYMDYSYCVRMFTQGQGDAMRTCLQNTAGGRDNLSSSTNLLATGVSNPGTCAPNADFIYDRSEVCVGAHVTFSDASQNGTPNAYNWTFTGATPSTSNLAQPTVVYNSPGVYSVTYSSSNGSGASSPITKTNIITVTNSPALYSANFTQSFETNVFAGPEWSEYSSSGGSHWVTTNVAALSGSYSAVIPNAANTRNMKTTMESPTINLSSFQSPRLSYWYASQETNPAHVNSFRVYVTSDCGDTWSLIDSISGMDLATAGIGPAPYIPANQSEWVERTIDLSTFSNSTSSYFKFLYTRDTVAGANTFYVDNINIFSSIGLTDYSSKGEYMSIYPNPSNSVLQVRFLNPPDKIYITNVLGAMQENIDNTSNLTQVTMLSTTHLSVGVYFVHAVFGNKEVVRKVIIN